MCICNVYTCIYIYIHTCKYYWKPKDVSNLVDNDNLVFAGFAGSPWPSS